MPLAAQPPAAAPENPAAEPARTSPLSAAMVVALDIANRLDLVSYRIGYAPRPAGPFLRKATVEALLAAGLVARAVVPSRRVCVTRRGRAALADIFARAAEAGR